MEAGLFAAMANHGRAVSLAVLVHLGVFILLLLSWEPDPKSLLWRPDPALSSQVPKLTAYFITAQELKAKMPVHNPLEESPEAAAALQATIKTPMPVTPAIPISNKAKSAPVRSDSKAHSAKENTETKTSVQENTPNSREVISSHQLLQATRGYLQREADASIDAMGLSRAKDVNAYGASLSEMTPEMPQYQVNIIEDKTQATTLDHRLDPNRRVKIGDTCYKVVKLGTQINPHAEGLGFAEPCDPVSPTKHALDAAISKRLSQMKLK